MMGDRCNIKLVILCNEITQAHPWSLNRGTCLQGRGVDCIVNPAPPYILIKKNTRQNNCIDIQKYIGKGASNIKQKSLVILVINIKVL